MEEQITEVKGLGRGRRIDDDIKMKAVAELKAETKKNKKGAVGRVADKYGVHSVTLTEWKNNPKFNKGARKTTTPKPRVNILDGTLRAKTKETTQAKSNGSKLSLRDTIAKLPTDYDGLLREHIKLLLEKQ